MKYQTIPVSRNRFAALTGKAAGLKTVLAVLLFVIALPFTFSQDLNTRITIKVKDAPFSAILEEVARQGHIYFSYNPELIPSGRLMTLRMIRVPVSEVLDKVLISNGIDYMIVENQVVLKKLTRDTPAPKIREGNRKLHTVSGFVMEELSGEMLIGANIYLEGTTTGVTSNSYGFYSLTVEEGSYPVVCSFVGYERELRKISLTRDTIISFGLKEATTEMKEVVVNAESRSSAGQTNTLNEMAFSHKTLVQLPGFGGNVDIIRALQVIPGIQTFGDGSSLYYVRGGNSDQNLMLIDDVPVYNPSHLFGFFSAFSPDAVNDVKIYKGDFPARYGGKLSSVIDIKVKEGNMKNYGFSGNIGPYASSLTLEGPVARDKASFFLSGRISTLNWLSGITPETGSLDFLFYDLHGKLNYLVNKRNRVFASFYTGEDVYSQVTSSAYRTYGTKWNNWVGAARWNHIFNNRVFANITFNYSKYNYFLFISENQDDYWRSTVSNVTGKADFTWFFNPSNTLKAGLEISSHFSNPGNVTLTDGSDQQQPAEAPKYHSAEYDLYFGNEQSIGRRVILRYGVRLPVWQNLGPTTVYYYNVNYQVSDTATMERNRSYSTFFRPEPRFSFQFTFNDRSVVKLSYCRMAQFMQMLTNSTSPFTAPAVWAPAGPNIRPQVADQVSAGYFRKLFKGTFSFSAEAYYKYYSENIDYRDHANLLYNPFLEGELRFGTAYSFGIELMLRKTEGNFTGWIGYTHSRSFIETEGVNNGNAYPAAYDRPNDICINLSYADKKHWIITANWIYLTGGAITTPVGFYYYNGYSVPVYGDKNNDRLPDYHRLDISATYTFSKPENRYQHSLTVTLYNVYGRYNPFSVNFNKSPGSQDEFPVPADIDGIFRLVPTTLSVAGIIPSINYKFRFL